MSIMMNTLFNTYKYDINEEIRIKPLEEIKQTLNSGRRYMQVFFPVEMEQFCGKPFMVKVYIDHNQGNPCYSLGGCSWTWCEEWLEPLNKYKFELPEELFEI